MSFSKGLRRMVGGIAKSAVPISSLSVSSPQGWLNGEDSDSSVNPAMKISTVNRCVEVLSNSMAVLPIYVMNEATKERLTGHGLCNLLQNRANEAMTAYDFQRLMMVNQLQRGNAYAWIYRSNKTAAPLELIPLPPDCVTPVVVGNALDYIFSHPNTGQTYHLDGADVIHYKSYSEDGLVGRSVLCRASVTLSTAKAAQQYENRLWSSGGQPSGVLTTESDIGGTVTVTDGDGNKTQVKKKDIIRNEWMRIHGGAANAFRVAVLDLGLKYQPIAMTNSDSQFVESNEIRIADICRFYGVPLHLVYSGKESYSSNEQNSIEYVNYTLLPFETQWGQEDTYKLLLPSQRSAHQRIKRELKVFLKGDSAAQAAWLEAMQRMGAYSVNEVRGLDDRGSVPGGDVRVASLNYVPLADFQKLSLARNSQGEE